MSRPTTSQIIAHGDYLQPHFDPATLTIPHLLGILSYHQINYPTQYNKAKLVTVFNEEIKGKGALLRGQRLDRQQTAASDDGIFDGVSGLPIGSENSVRSRLHSLTTPLKLALHVAGRHLCGDHHAVYLGNHRKKLYH